MSEKAAFDSAMESLDLRIRGEDRPEIIGAIRAHEAALQQRIAEQKETIGKWNAIHNRDQERIAELEAKCAELTTERDGAKFKVAAWMQRSGICAEYVEQLEAFKAKVLNSVKVPRLDWRTGYESRYFVVPCEGVDDE